MPLVNKPTIASRLMQDPRWASVGQSAHNLNALRQQQQPQRSPMQAYQDSVAARAAEQQRQARMQALDRASNPFYEFDEAVRRGWLPEGSTPMDWEQMKAGTPQDRKTAKDAAGMLRYIDTGEQVFPDVDIPPEEREMKQDVNDVWRYVDTGEQVFSQVEAQPDLTANIDEVGKIRKEFRDETKTFKDQQSSFGRILASAREPSAAGDLALIFNYMKVLDPGSTVREGEFATAASAGGVDERIVAQYNRIRDGERLTEGQRRDFVQRASKLYQEAAGDFEGSVEEYRTLSESYGFDPERVILRSVKYPPDAYADLLDDLGDIPD